MEEQVSPWQFAVIADPTLTEEFEAKGIPSSCLVHYVDTPAALPSLTNCEAYFDLLFRPDQERIQAHLALSPTPVFVNCISLTTDELQQIAGDYGDTVWNIVRINAWPTFLRRNILELAETSMPVKTIFEKLGWSYEITPDIPGLITARVISTIINEAYFALGEEVSTKEEIDTAMKLGTSYPYGPFEWAGKIGLGRITELLDILSDTNPRYTTASLLKQEALS